MIADRRPRLMRVADDAFPIDLAKRDMTLVYGGRSYAVRAYRDGTGADGPGWHAVVIDVENRTPLRHGLGASLNPADCIAASVRFLVAAIEATIGEAIAIA